MSRIGKIPVAIPSGVEVKVDGHVVTVKGSKGELTREFNPMMTIKVEGEEVIVERPDDSRQAKSLHGLTRTLIHNMVEGVHDGYSKKLELVGVGYRAALKGSDLEIQLGYSHPVIVKAPENITFEVPSQTELTTDILAFIANTLALVRLRLTPCADVGSNLADLFLADALYDNLGPEFKATEKSGATVDGAAALGLIIGKKAQENGVTEVVFDRGGNLYHGRIKAVADGAREAGLKF